MVQYYLMMSYLLMMGEVGCSDEAVRRMKGYYNI